MNELAKLRAAQRTASERELSRARSEVRRLLSLKDKSEQTMQLRQEAWIGSLSGATFVPELARAWATSVQETEAELVHLGGLAGRAEAESDRCRERWLTAQLEQDRAEDLAQTAARSDRKRREVLALAEAEEQAMRAKAVA